MNALNEAVVGHNSAEIRVEVEVRMFNSISRYAGKEGSFRKLNLPAGSDISTVLKYLGVPQNRVFLVYVNGRDITPRRPGMGDIRTTYVFEDGDVIALSGPVPYSCGYGAPVV